MIKIKDHSEIIKEAAERWKGDKDIMISWLAGKVRNLQFKSNETEFLLRQALGKLQQ